MHALMKTLTIDLKMALREFWWVFFKDSGAGAFFNMWPETLDPSKNDALKITPKVPP